VESHAPTGWIRKKNSFEPRENSDDVIEVLGEGGQAMPSDQSALLGFINGADDSYDSPTCSSYGSEFPAEDSSLDVAISQTNLIRSHPLFMEGVLLKCVDAKPLFPYMHYAIFQGSDHDMRIANIDEVIRGMNLRPKCQFGAYDEMYSIQKITPRPDARLPSHRHAGYIVISFKILEDETQQESLEKSWLSWSGAREIYKYSPRTWNLRRISLHKFPKRRRSGPCHSFAYVMMCEFGSILHPSNRLQALDMCERFRVRNCGYVCLYQISSPFIPRPLPKNKQFSFVLFLRTVWTYPTIFPQFCLFFRAMRVSHLLENFCHRRLKELDVSTHMNISSIFDTHCW
uniref:DUF7153 domain-containing protein n=1 Tax=Parascaris univalens TaxID=6257 RepID=A0A915BM12_PARUN